MNKIFRAAKEIFIGAPTAFDLPKPLIGRDRVERKYSVQRKILDTILKNKRISFEKYMSMALYSRNHGDYDAGYYTSGEALIGEACHFNTFPQSNSPVFGQGIAKQLNSMWEALGCPKVFHAIEMGAGNGIMARDILRYVNKEMPDFYKALKYVIIEISNPLIQRQKNSIDPMLRASVEWKNASAIKYKFKHKITGCFLSNELVDNLPVHELFGYKNEAYETYITYNGFTIEKEPVKLSSRKVIDMLKTRFSTFPVPEKIPFYVSTASIDWLKNLADNLKRGYILTIDYGTSDMTKYFYEHDTLRTYSRLVTPSHKNDPLYYIGKADITADVDFGSLVIYGRKFGLRKVGYFNQDYYFSQILSTPLIKSEMESGPYGMRVLIQAKKARLKLG